MAHLEELLPEFRKGAKIRRSIWDNKEIFVKINEMGEPVLNNGNKFEFCKNITCSDWELYQEPIDWDYIIDHNCLCWFWDDKFNWAICGTLGKTEKGAEYGFIMFDDSGNRSSYKNCRPVRRDEVTFYEDRKE